MNVGPLGRLGLTILLLTTAQAATSQEQKKKNPPKEPTLADTKAALNLPVDTTLFPQMNLKEVFEILTKEMNKRGKKVLIKVNVEAFKDDNPDAPSIYDTQFILKTKSKTLAVSTILSMSLSGVHGGNATFKVRRGYIEITTVRAAAREK